MIDALIPALALAAQAAPAPVTLTPAQFAEAISGMVGQSYEGGVTIAGIHAEGHTLVILLDGPAGWRASASAGQVPAHLVTSFCEDRDFEYFTGGNRMRVDTEEGGAALHAGPVISACPPRAPDARPQ